MIRIGEYRHRITIQENAMVSDGEGGFRPGWDDVISVWAKITSVQAQQQYKFNSVGVEATHRVCVRGNIEISEANRITFKSRVFEIKTIENTEERNIEKVITCRELR